MSADQLALFGSDLTPDAQVVLAALRTARTPLKPSSIVKVCEFGMSMRGAGRVTQALKQLVARGVVVQIGPSFKAVTP